MAINYINTGSSPNKGDGDTLRTAFNKINANFAYVNQISGITANADLSAAVFTNNNLHSGITVNYNSSTQQAALTLLTATNTTIGGVKIGAGLTINSSGVLSSVADLSAASSSIIPVESNFFNIGSPTAIWSNLYVNSVSISGTTLTIDTASNLLINGVPIGTGPQGPTGNTGTQGPMGTIATIDIGTVSTGTTATVTVTGTSSINYLNFVLPQGPAGPQGEVGPIGSTGPQGVQGTPGNYSIGNYSFTADTMNMPDSAKLITGIAGSAYSAEINTTLKRESVANLNTATIDHVTLTEPTFGLVAYSILQSTYPNFTSLVFEGTLITGAALNGQLGYDGQTPKVYAIQDESTGTYWKIVSTLPVSAYEFINTGSGFDLTFQGVDPITQVVDNKITVGVHPTTATITGITATATNVVISNNTSTWQFNAQGGLVFPDATVQYTAGSGSIDLSAVAQNIIPSTNIGYDLGSPTHRWKDLYLSSGTLYIGSVSLSATDAGTLAIPGITSIAYKPGSIVDTRIGPYYNATPWVEPDYTLLVIDQVTYQLATNPDLVSYRASYVFPIYSAYSSEVGYITDVSLSPDSVSKGQYPVPVIRGQQGTILPAGSEGTPDYTYWSTLNAEPMFHILSATDFNWSSLEAACATAEVISAYVASESYSIPSTPISSYVNDAGYLTTESDTLDSVLARGSSTVQTITAGHIIPAADKQYDLGTSSTQWRSLYVGTATIYIDNIPLSINATNNTVVVGPAEGQSTLASEDYVTVAIAGIPAGPKGDQGPIGNTGTQGIQGPIGPQGIQGNTGTVGIQGPIGNTGTQGVQGPIGDTGAQGISITLVGSSATTTVETLGAGSAGQGWINTTDGDIYFWNTLTTLWENIGPIVGPQGERGLQGVQGAQGEQGIPGAKGDTGAQGSKGDQGDQGPQGEQGIQGIQGNTGTQGLIGPTGPKGDRGDTGLTGDTGPQGATGPQGNTGSAATITLGTVTVSTSTASVTNVGTTSSAIFNFVLQQGPQGVQGPAGNDGAQGPQGDPGPAGADGAQGPAGADGAPGTSITGWTVTTGTHFVPNTDNLQDIGTPVNRVRHVYVGPGSVYIGNNVITEAATGGLVLPGVTRATGYYADEVENEDRWGSNPAITGTITVIDATRYQILAGQTPSVNYNPALYIVQKDGNRVDEINIDNGGSGWTKVEADYARDNNMYATNVSGAIDNFNAGDWTQIPFRVEIKAEDTEYEDIFGGGSLTVGNGTSASVENVTELLINGTITEIEPGVVGVTIAGGTTQPYLELTQKAFITQPVTLGTPVTITASQYGRNALLSVNILPSEGPLLDSITVDEPGSGYVAGQRYIIGYWQVGGNDDADNIIFEVGTVGPGGTLLTVANATFQGTFTASNTPATYTGVSFEYIATEFDEVDTGLTLARGAYGGFFNSEEEFSYNSSVSPIGTLWNADGWETLVGFNSRTYGTFDSILTGPDNTPPPELVMWDTINDKYYKFGMNVWGVDNNEYSYTRTLITDPNYFKKTDGLQDGEIDVIVEDDGDGAGIGITRGNEQGIYNPYREGGWDSNNSPAGTVWNIDGWNDLTDIESRTYTNFYAAYGSGALGSKVPGSKAIMYVPEINKHYAIDWISWTQGGNYGGFSYSRREIDLTKLDQGVRFADNTVQTTAYIPTNIVSTAPGERRIETASGYNQVSVTQRVTDNYTGAINATTDGYELRVARTTELDAVLVPINNGNTSATFTLSFDNITFREVWLSSVQETEYWFYYQNDLGQTTPQTEDDPVYLTVTTGGDSVAWWSKNSLPGGSDNFRGAVIDYHAYTGDGTIIGTIHIVDDDGEEYITHTEVSSGSTDSMNNDLWIVTSEGTIRYARFDGEASTLKIHWTAKVFYGDELYD